jgi:hypothetical protein
VPHAYNLRYLRGRDKEDCSLRLTWEKKKDPMSTTTKKAGLPVQNYNPSYTGSISRRTEDQASHG